MQIKAERSAYTSKHHTEYQIKSGFKCVFCQIVGAIQSVEKTLACPSGTPDRHNQTLKVVERKQTNSNTYPKISHITLNATGTVSSAQGVMLWEIFSSKFVSAL